MSLTRILVVTGPETNDAIRRTMGRRMSGTGFAERVGFCHAATPAEGWTHFQVNRPPAIVAVDTNGKPDWFELLRKMREAGYTGRIVIFRRSCGVEEARMCCCYDAVVINSLNGGGVDMSSLCDTLLGMIRTEVLRAAS